MLTRRSGAGLTRQQDAMPTEFFTAYKRARVVQKCSPSVAGGRAYAAGAFPETDRGAGGNLPRVTMQG